MIVRKLLLFITLLLWGGETLNAQKVFRGTVVGNRGGIVAYANIGLTSFDISTVSDTTGNFSLAIKEKYIPTDTILFSSLGFKDRAIALKDINFNQPNRIILEEQPYEVPTIYVFAHKSKKKIITNGVIHPDISIYADTRKEDYPNGLLGKEFCFFLEKKEDIYTLNTFGIEILSNTFSFIRIRANIYNIKDGLPDKKIAEGESYLDIPARVIGWVRCPVNRTIEEDVYVGLEIIEVRGSNENHSLRFSATMSKDRYFYRSSCNKNLQDFRDALQTKERGLRNGKISYQAEVTYYKKEEISYTDPEEE